MIQNSIFFHMHPHAQHFIHRSPFYNHLNLVKVWLKFRASILTFLQIPLYSIHVYCPLQVLHVQFFCSVNAKYILDNCRIFLGNKTFLLRLFTSHPRFVYIQKPQNVKIQAQGMKLNSYQQCLDSIHFLSPWCFIDLALSLQEWQNCILYTCTIMQASVHASQNGLTKQALYYRA